MMSFPVAVEMTVFSAAMERCCAEFCAQAAQHLKFDIIHAHDWMTYPAGLLVARLTGNHPAAALHAPFHR